MRLELTWSEDALCWEVTIWRRGKRLGVTQVKRLDDLGQTVLDYLELASDEPMNPTAAITDSLKPKQLKASVEDTAQEIVHGFLCACPGDGVDIHPCPQSATVGAIVERLDQGGVLRRGEDPQPAREVRHVGNDDVVDSFLVMINSVGERFRRQSESEVDGD